MNNQEVKTFLLKLVYAPNAEAVNELLKHDFF